MVINAQNCRGPEAPFTYSGLAIAILFTILLPTSLFAEYYAKCFGFFLCCLIALSKKSLEELQGENSFYQFCFESFGRKSAGFLRNCRNSRLKIEESGRKLWISVWFGSLDLKGKRFADSAES